MFFFTHDQFNALMLASLDSRDAVMVLLRWQGHRGSGAAVLADAILALRYRYTDGGVVVTAQQAR